MRIVAFGCSHTYGHSLPDCVVDKYLPGPHPSHFAFPSLIANQLGVMCINKSVPGASNLQILLNILQFNFLPNDLVLVMWTFPNRGTLFTEKKQLVKIAPWLLSDNIDKGILIDYSAKKDKTPKDSVIGMARSFYETHSDYHLRLMSWLYMDMASMFLDKIHIKKIFVTFDNAWNISENPMLDCRSIKEPLDSYEIDYGFDGFHPGLETHKIWANKILEVLKNNKN
jgi:hypothetical protein